MKPCRYISCSGFSCCVDYVQFAIVVSILHFSKIRCRPNSRCFATTVIRDQKAHDQTEIQLRSDPLYGSSMRHNIKKMIRVLKTKEWPLLQKQCTEGPLEVRANFRCGGKTPQKSENPHTHHSGYNKKNTTYK